MALNEKLSKNLEIISKPKVTKMMEAQSLRSSITISTPKKQEETPVAPSPPRRPPPQLHRPPTPVDENLKPIASVVGRGYDFTSLYADSTRIKGVVLDFGALLKDGIVERDNNQNVSKDFNESSTNVVEISNELQGRVGVKANAGVWAIGSFSAEFETAFGRKNIEKNSLSVAMRKKNIAHYGYRPSSRDTTKLQKYLTSAFTGDLKSKSAAKIIELYGTHVMLGGIWGARLDWYYSKQISSTERLSTDSIKVNADVKVDLLKLLKGGVNVSTYVEWASRVFNENTNESSSLVVYGGRPEFAKSGDAEKWENSIKGNEIWCDYYPNAVFPIYDFVSDKEKKATIKLAYDNYIKKNAIQVADITPRNKIVQLELRAEGTGINKGGDNEMNTQSGKDTYYELELTLREETMYKKINAYYRYMVKEMKGDHTTIESTGNTDLDLGVSCSDFKINLPQSDKKITITGSYKGKTHSYVAGSTKGFVKKLQVKFDSDRKDDRGAIGFIASMQVPITYVGEFSGISGIRLPPRKK